ncbi:2589_t:CDS:2 [Diversispora eburnea]|uniref:2589_t:CDS:1 n=1 Tax=Diversispora eburnea TaxID=1213867 RepID=A0A9N9FSD9_9GLOM|nr:2589_t:CDS:2 [Diversispora eburnea]
MINNYENDQEQDDIEWVSGSSMTRMRWTNNSFDDVSTAYVIPLRQIHYNSAMSHCTHSTRRGDMALLVHAPKREISICLNNMRNEISISMKEIESFRLGRDFSIVIKLKFNFVRTYYFHSKGFPYRDKPTRTNKDPTNGRLNTLRCFNLKPETHIGTAEITRLDELFKNLLFPQMSQLNQNFPPQKYYNSVYQNDGIKMKEMYITCIIPTQKRAVVYSSDGILSHFKFHVRQRFGWKWERMWYKSDMGGWYKLEEESDWKNLKRQAQDKGLPRTEIYFR